VATLAPINLAHLVQMVVHQNQQNQQELTAKWVPGRTPENALQVAMEDVKGKLDLLHAKLQAVDVRATPLNEKLFATLRLAQKKLNVKILQQAGQNLLQEAIKAAWPEDLDGTRLNFAECTAKAPAQTELGVLRTQSAAPYTVELVATKRWLLLIS